MIPDYPNIPKDILDYINSHPHHVKTSGFFESQLPKVPKGILKLPTTLG